MDPFLAEIRILPFGYAPKNWAFCNGQQMPVSQNTALFSLIGTTYGGDGRSVFLLPNLQGRAAMHPFQGPGLSPRVLGQAGGTETVTLVQNQVPPHNHALMASAAPANNKTPATNEALGRTTAGFYQTSNANLTPLNGSTLKPVGTGGPHNNMQPYLTLNFNICLAGVYPQRP